MIIEHGNAFNAVGSPRFLVVSIYDDHPPGPEWTKSTSLKAFSELVHLSANRFANKNCAIVTDAWRWMRTLVRGHPSVQTYYEKDAYPVPVYKLVHLEILGSRCAVLLVHAPDFRRLPYAKAMSILVSLNRTVHEMCALRGGRAEDARMSPLCAGAFATPPALPKILGACVDELFTRTSAPVSVYGFSAPEYAALKAHEARRANDLGLKSRTPTRTSSALTPTRPSTTPTPTPTRTFTRTTRAGP